MKGISVIGIMAAALTSPGQSWAGPGSGPPEAAANVRPPPSASGRTTFSVRAAAARASGLLRQVKTKVDAFKYADISTPAMKARWDFAQFYAQNKTLNIGYVGRSPYSRCPYDQRKSGTLESLRRDALRVAGVDAGTTLGNPGGAQGAMDFKAYVRLAAVSLKGALNSKGRALDAADARVLGTLLQIQALRPDRVRGKMPAASLQYYRDATLTAFCLMRQSGGRLEPLANISDALGDDAPRKLLNIPLRETVLRPQP